MRRALAGLGALVLVAAGYLTADAFDVVPGVLTIDRTPATAGMPSLPTVTPGASPSPTVTPVPVPSVAASASPLTAAGPTAALPTAAGVAAALARAVVAAGLGSSVGVTVRDASTGAHLLDISADSPRTPASTVKLLTAAAITTSLAPDLTFATRAVRGAGAHDVILVAGGDTLLSPGEGTASAVAGRAGLADLARQTARALTAQAVSSVRLHIDERYAFGDRYARGWLPVDIRAGLTGGVAMLGLSTQRPAPGSPASTDPALSTARAFARALTAEGLAVASVIDRKASSARAAELGVVRSAPVAEVLGLALDESDDALTESLARQAAVKAGRGTSFAAVTAWVTDALVAKGVDMLGVTMIDTSGLSRGSLVPARVLGDVLALAAAGRYPALQDVVAQLPVAGLSGTLADRFVRGSDHAAAGLARAKTGTLTGVSALAGTVVDKDGRLLTFALLADNVAPGVGTLNARAALDRFVATLARCGCG